MKTKCGIYYRVSTDSQELADQKNRLPKYGRIGEAMGQLSGMGLRGKSADFSHLFVIGLTPTQKSPQCGQSPGACKGGHDCVFH